MRRANAKALCGLWSGLSLRSRVYARDWVIVGQAVASSAAASASVAVGAALGIKCTGTPWMGLDASFAVTMPGAARLASVATYIILHPVLFYTSRYDDVMLILSVLLLVESSYKDKQQWRSCISSKSLTRNQHVLHMRVSTNNQRNSKILQSTPSTLHAVVGKLGPPIRQIMSLSNNYTIFSHSILCGVCCEFWHAELRLSSHRSSCCCVGDIGQLQFLSSGNTWDMDVVIGR
ncbi:uncharacterized protein BKA55DRAFT_17499 [Fusarium redolens]|uniref:Uncharacterized protein n=1 Tax=Fusarium redolens TaxID=48865 RepID=A0A9P9KW36_FUSRE|nr:uncharacterized protein BKA55DRAFT_17499 [Fusarium redolens]KAH7269624.1 hypothetical protein BKA55DRAFT_17499 [Fusarium redolens]